MQQFALFRRRGGISDRGRIRFGTQKIDPSLRNEFIVYRFSTGRTVQVALKDGVFPAELSALERKVRGGSFSVEEMRLCQRLQFLLCCLRSVAMIKVYF